MRDFVDWFPWYFQLYKDDTMHLDVYQDGCYRRLIDHYMESRRPLPNDDRALARIVGDSHDRWMILAAPVVRPFFQVKGKFLHLSRCDSILHYQDEKTKKQSESGKKGAAIRKQNKNLKSNEIKDLPSTPQGSAYTQVQVHLQEDKKESLPGLQKSQSLDISTPKNILTKKSGMKNPADVSETVWADFLQHRKAKKAPVTETVISRIRSEADKVGWPLENALAEICSRGWQGFKAEWITNNQGKKQNETHRSTGPTHAERMDAAFASAHEKYLSQFPDEDEEKPKVLAISGPCKPEL